MARLGRARPFRTAASTRTFFVAHNDREGVAKAATAGRIVVVGQKVITGKAKIEAGPRTRTTSGKCVRSSRPRVAVGARARITSGRCARVGKIRQTAGARVTGFGYRPVDTGSTAVTIANAQTVTLTLTALGTASATVGTADAVTVTVR